MPGALRFPRNLSGLHTNREDFSRADGEVTRASVRTKSPRTQRLIAYVATLDVAAGTGEGLFTYPFELLPSRIANRTAAPGLAALPWVAETASMSSRQSYPSGRPRPASQRHSPTGSPGCQ